jgi:hypothetical protein
MRGGRAAVVVVLAALLAACGAGGGRPAKGRTYTVRAQVIQLPAPGSRPGSLTVQHEAVDDFVGRDGQVEGMDPMAMPFPLAEGVSLAGVAAGDVVEMKLHVDWDAEPAVRITGVRKLPPGTRLAFRAAAPGRKP